MPNSNSIPFIGPVLPRSAAHAAELELEGLGALSVRSERMYYRDNATGINCAKWMYKDNREANLQMSFFRVSAKDKKDSRRYLRLVYSNDEAQV